VMALVVARCVLATKAERAIVLLVKYLNVELC
jgi:hypothetical protein